MSSVALGLVVAVALVLLGLWLGRLFDRRDRVERSAVALAGERDAEALLLADGWRVVERQAQARWTIEVDGAPRAVQVRADLLVERDGALAVAEVKTGSLAPSLAHAPTRRQLLEYALVFDVREVLLVDATEGRVSRVRFPV